MIELTTELRKQYNKASFIRNVIFVTIADIIFIVTTAMPLYYTGLVTSWLIVLIIFPWAILVRIIYNKWIIPRIWRYTVELTEEQFIALHGKEYIPPPTFKDIFKYQGENDIDWVLNQYNGFRIIRWTEKPPHIVYFRKEEDAVHFKLALV